MESGAAPDAFSAPFSDGRDGAHNHLQSPVQRRGTSRDVGWFFAGIQVNNLPLKKVSTKKLEKLVHVHLFKMFQLLLAQQPKAQPQRVAV